MSYLLLGDRTGTAAIEFAILSPLYLMLLLGMTAYGLYFGAAHSVQQIAADAARLAVSGIDDADRRDIVSRFVQQNAGQYVLINPAKVNFNVSETEGGSRFLVEIRYDASGLPIWGLFEALPKPEMTISRRSTIRIGGL
ncbi:TadE/TadG family type IV pilus assembly protein [Aquamicrobium sp. LC103]|uniref:TadE/TadG family type IV pilus assembly protein n=1 Tax=Aquamicrobium sp. LC103 TaxID=1120658 RepID=UPI001FEF3C04|nr:TadE/TadG family type IV pilus assembly protein [Aquamicrobium sp. LC103]